MRTLLLTFWPSRSSHKNAKYHVVSAAHVTHPFLYPRLYPEEFPRFLSFLKESDVKVALQYRELDTGALLTEFPLRKQMSVKVDSDLVVAHILDEEALEEEMKKRFGEEVLALQLKQSVPDVMSEVELLGHDFTMNANGHHVLVPVSLPGSVLGGNKRRIVVDTPQPSVMGLCGGPVLELKQDGQSTTIVVGMVEGRIQSSITNPSMIANDSNSDPKMHKALADKTVLLSSLDIADFLVEVEKDLENMVNENKPPEHVVSMPQLSADLAMGEAAAIFGSDFGLDQHPGSPGSENASPFNQMPSMKAWDPNSDNDKEDVDF